MSDSGKYDHWSGDITTFTYDANDELIDVSLPCPPIASCEHDEKKRVFRITDPGGRVTEYHDRPVRFLVVVPDPETGELTRVLWGAKPRVMYLCREAGL